mgnify:CR=1 FL=1
MGDIVNIRPPTIAENIVRSLNEATDTEELYVLRVCRVEGGERHLEWYTTVGDSLIWSVGALHYVAYKLMDGAGGYCEEDEDGSA